MAQTITQVMKANQPAGVENSKSVALTYLRPLEQVQAMLVRNNPQNLHNQLRENGEEWAFAELPSNPRMSEVSELYGTATTSALLKSYIVRTFGALNLSHGTNITDSVSRAETLIRCEYQAIRMREVILFLSQLEDGCWGDFFGSYSTAKFGKALREFWSWRCRQKQAKYQKERLAKMRASFARSVSRAEYERMKAAGEI